MWLIWTRQAQAELETIVSSAVSSGGTVKDLAGFDSLSSFAAKYQTGSPKASKDSVNQRTVVVGTGDVIAHRFELEHR